MTAVLEKSPKLLSIDPQSVNPLQGTFLDSEEVLIKNLHALAYSIGLAVAQKMKLSNVPIPQPTTELQEITLDTALPTCVVFEGGGFCGTDLMAYAVASRQLGMNVVFAASNVSQILVESNEGYSQLAIRTGIIVCPDGHVEYGKFAEPVPISFALVHHRDLATFKLMHLANCPCLTSYQVQSICDDKAKTEAACGADLFPKSLLIDFHNLESSLALIPNDTRLVIKPTDCCQGIGVQIVEIGDCYALTEGLVKGVRDYGQVLVQTKIDSLPLYDRQQQRLDWNLRVIVVDGELIDMEVRIARDGKAINKSNGAEIKEFDSETFSGTILEKLIAQELVKANLSLLVKDISKTIPEGFLGLDVIVDQNLSVHLIEINAGLVGGLSSLALIRDDENHKLLGPIRVTEIILDKIVANSEVPSEVQYPELPEVKMDFYLGRRIDALLGSSRLFDQDERPEELQKLLTQLDRFLQGNSKQREYVAELVLDNGAWDDPNLDLKILDFAFRNGHRSSQLAGRYQRIINSDKTNSASLRLALEQYPQASESVEDYITNFALNYFKKIHSGLELDELVVLGNCLPQLAAPTVTPFTAFFYFALGDNQTAKRLCNFFDPKDQSYSLVGLRAGILYRSGRHRAAIEYLMKVTLDPNCRMKTAEINNLHNQALALALQNGERKIFKNLVSQISSSGFDQDLTDGYVAYSLRRCTGWLKVKSVIRSFCLHSLQKRRLSKIRTIFAENFADTVGAPNKADLDRSSLVNKKINAELQRRDPLLLFERLILHLPDFYRDFKS